MTSTVGTICKKASSVDAGVFDIMSTHHWIAAGGKDEPRRPSVVSLTHFMTPSLRIW